MTFLNGLLALGAGAFLIPLAIHLLFRNRYRTLNWGAMHLLSGVVASNQRRIEIRHWLLLALRCSVPILLALALARPILTGLQAGRGDAPRSLVMLIDDSRSMLAVDQSGQSRLAKARQSIVSVLGDLTRRDEVMVLRTSQLNAPLQRVGATRAASLVSAIDAEQGPADFGRALRAALDAAANASHSVRQIIVVSDFQSRDWSDPVLKSIRELGEAGGDQDLSPTISFLNVSDRSREIENVVVESVSIDAPAAVAGRPIKCNARLRNASDRPVDGLRVQWSVDGQSVGSNTVSIEPRSTSVVQRTLQFGRAGLSEVRVSIEHEDGLLADNRRTMAVNVIDRIRVLLVDGHPDPRDLKGETDYLSVALNPFVPDAANDRSAVETTVVDVDGVSAKLRQSSYQAVVLANLGRLPAASRTAIAQYVLGGGSLVVFDGDQMDPDSFNRPWSSGDESFTMPGQLGSVESVAENDEPLAVARAELRGTPWEMLERVDSLFDSFEIYRYRKLTTNDQPSRADVAGSDVTGSDGAGADAAGSDGARSEAAGADVSPLTNSIAMASGDPLVLMRSAGQGQIVQFAIPCDTDWTSLPQRSVFVPMMQQLMLHLAGSSNDANLVTGEPVLISATALLRSGNATGARHDDFALSSFAVTPPGRPTQTFTRSQDSDPSLLFASTENPGTYRIRARFEDAAGETLEVSTLRVVEVPASESVLRDVDRQRLDAAANSISASVFTSPGQMLRDDRVIRTGREVWTWLLLIVVASLFAELWLQQSEIRRRHAVGAAS